MSTITNKDIVNNGSWQLVDKLTGQVIMSGKGGIYNVKQKSIDFLPIEITISNVGVSCQHNWKSSNSESGKTKWCSKCDRRE